MSVAAAVLAAASAWWMLAHRAWLGVDQRVSARLTAVGTVLAAVLVGAAWALDERLLGVVLWASVLAAVADWAERVIPNRWVLVVTLAALARMALGILPVWPTLLLAGAVGGFFLVMHLLMRGGLGLGDVKLAGALALALGWPRGLDAFVWGLMAAGVYALGLVVAKRARLEDSMAFGPFLALGAALAVLAI